MEINNFDMSEHTLYFDDVLKVIIEEFNIKQLSRVKIAFRSLRELEDFPINIDTSSIFVFDNREYLEVDMSKIKVSGYSTIQFNTSPNVYDKFRKFDENNFFSSIMNKGDELFRAIIGNSSLKQIDFYTPNVINIGENQKQIDIKIPETLEYSK